MEYAVVLLPLLGSVISGFFGKNIGSKQCQILTSSFVSISAILSLFIFYQVFLNDYSSNKLIFTAKSISSIDINIIIIFFLFKNMPTTPIEKTIAPRVK